MNALSLHTHIQRRGASGIYYIRRRIPTDLLSFYAPKKEIALSLKTKDPKEAKERGRLEAIRIDQQFAAARRSLAQEQKNNPPTEAVLDIDSSQAATPPKAPLTSLEIERLALLHLHTALAEDENARDVPKQPDALAKERHEANALATQLGITLHVPTFGLSAKEAEVKRGHAELFLQAAPLYLATNDFSPVENTVDALLETEHLSVDRETPAYHKLCRAVFMAECKAHEAILKRMDGEWIETPRFHPSTAQGNASAFSTVSAPLSISPANPAPHLATPGPDNPLLSEVWKRYVKERCPANKTIADFGTSVRRFIQLNGDLPVKSITKAHIRDFKDAALKLPSIPQLPKKIRELPVPRLIATLEKQYKGKPYPTLAAKTVNEKLLAAIKTILSYAVANGYIENNPVIGIRAISNKNDITGPGRLPYDIEDLRNILSSPLFVGEIEPSCMGRMKEARRIDYQWITLLAIFTGARLEEIGQLDVNDIYTDGDIWCIHIHADLETNRRVKNKSSIRKIPVHPELLKFGFLEFVQAQSQGDKLFKTVRSATEHRTGGCKKFCVIGQSCYPDYRRIDDGRPQRYTR